ncbi:hypothetical protein [Suttonella ornithocola]|uniref:Trans-aconitate 2-methyltransferase n=1 Tax=Suttonella ornithocola TaxID=279832 RepID=A0A380MN18_9GAMM|nr:hypothetical protein [Suttonella ornithocola]SUO93293.1 trans-aconitate 2-methyltransferase [Suttonella ornithocola]
MLNPQRSFAAAQAHYPKYATDQLRLAQQLAQAITKYCTHPIENIFEVGCGTGALSQALYQHPFPYAARYYVNDLNPIIAFPVPAKQRLTSIGDIRCCPLPTPLQMITSSSALQWLEQTLFSELSRFISHLSEKGYLAISLYIDKHYQELAQYGIGLKYHTTEKILHYLQQAGTLLWFKEQYHCEYFASPNAVLTHCRATGVNAFTASLGDIRHLLKSYPKTQQGYPLTHHSLSIIIQK